MIKLQDFPSDYNQIKKKLKKKLERLHSHHNYILGPEVKELEKRLSIFSRYKFCVTLASGSDAILISLLSMNFKKGSEIIVPAVSWISTASSVILAGLKPVFVDIDLKTACINYQKIEEKITKKTKCVISVNLYGNKPNYKKIIDLCNKYKLKIIEDGAQSFGSINSKKKLEKIHVMCTSFFPAKTLGCYGDGGACFTNSKRIYEKIRMLKILGQKRKSYSMLLGINSRLDTYQACVLLSKLDYYSKNLKKRFEIASLYKSLLEKINIECLIDLSIKDNTCTSFPILISNRDEFIDYMKKNKIEIGVNYPYALIDQPLFKIYKKGLYKNSISLTKKVVCLPINPYIKNEQVRYIVNKIKKFIL